MNPEPLILAREFVGSGLVSPAQMATHLGVLQDFAAALGKEFPNARFAFDADEVLRVEASAPDAAEIDYLLNENISTFTPYAIMVRK